MISVARTAFIHLNCNLIFFDPFNKATRQPFTPAQLGYGVEQDVSLVI